MTEQFYNVGSFLFTLELAFGIVKRADQLLQDADVAGVVVTCGTDTMEEIAYLADLIVSSDKPIVFTSSSKTPAPGAWRGVWFGGVPQATKKLDHVKV